MLYIIASLIDSLSNKGSSFFIVKFNVFDSSLNSKHFEFELSFITKLKVLLVSLFKSLNEYCVPNGYLNKIP